MKKYLSIVNPFLWYCILLFLSSILACSRQDQKLIVATAANTQFALENIAKEFTTDTGIEVDLVISSSGKHTVQILAGAPYDVFISADLKYPEKLYAEGMTTAKPKIYAYGQLVLWSMNKTTPYQIDDLVHISGKHIAIPNPATAPYGIAAQEVLNSMNHWNKLEPLFVYGESVAQTNQYIVSGAAEVGFTAASIVNSPKNDGSGSWTIIPDSLHSPIKQGAVVLKRSTQPVLADKFYNYLFSEKAGVILKSFGYKTEHL